MAQRQRAKHTHLYAALPGASSHAWTASGGACGVRAASWRMHVQSCSASRARAEAFGTYVCLRRSRAAGTACPEHRGSQGPTHPPVQTCRIRRACTCAHYPAANSVCGAMHLVTSRSGPAPCNAGVQVNLARSNQRRGLWRAAGCRCRCCSRDHRSFGNQSADAK